MRQILLLSLTALFISLFFGIMGCVSPESQLVGTYVLEKTKSYNGYSLEYSGSNTITTTLELKSDGTYRYEVKNTSTVPALASISPLSNSQTGEWKVGRYENEDFLVFSPPLMGISLRKSGGNYFFYSMLENEILTKKG